jgi:hypothetical protein
LPQYWRHWRCPNCTEEPIRFEGLCGRFQVPSDRTSW